jgi:prepilin-type N-terminal cleavage/methylation domain-containing protein
MSLLQAPRARTPQGGFTLVEVIIAIVVGAIVGVMFLAYMGTQLSKSGDPVNITREEGVAEAWMERILSDYVQEINGPGSYATALATVYARDYTAPPYNMPASVTLTRTYITYDAGGNEVAAAGGTNLKVILKAGGYGLTTVITAERGTTSFDPLTTIYY